MAHQNQAPAFFIMAALLLFVAATPLAHGQVQPVNINAINVGGQVCCSSNGSCNGTAAGIQGLLVTLNCTNLAGVTVTVGQNVTGVSGIYNITAANIGNTLGPVVGGFLPCVVVMKLPLNQTVCPILKTTTGVLAGLPILINTVLSSILGVIGNFSVTLLAVVKLG